MKLEVTVIRTGNGTRTRRGGIGNDPFACKGVLNVVAVMAGFYDRVEADLLEDLRRNDPVRFGAALREHLENIRETRRLDRGRSAKGVRR